MSLHSVILPSEFKFIERGWFNGNNILLLGDGGPVIVDTGHLQYVDETLALMREVGVEPADIQQIVITHGHSDHHGGNRRIKALSGAPIGMGPLTAEWFATQNYEMLWATQLGQEMDLVPADEIYEPGSRIVLAGMPFEVVAIPGHAPDSVAYFQPDTKVVICADAMWPNGDVGVLHTALHGEGLINDALGALENLRGLGAEIALPGHGGIITDVAENLAAVEAKLTRFKENPIEQVKHVVRRFTMYSLMGSQPIALEDLVQAALNDPGLMTYAQQWRPDLTAEQLFRYVIAQFMERGLVYEEEGMLKCVVSV